MLKYVGILIEILGMLMLLAGLLAATFIAANTAVKLSKLTIFDRALAYLAVTSAAAIVISILGAVIGILFIWLGEKNN